MPDYFISEERAGNDLLDCAAFIAERIKSSDGRAEAMKAIIPLYLARGLVDLAAELANGIDDPHVRDRLLMRVATKCAETDDDEYALQLVAAIEDHGLQQQAFEEVALTKAEKQQFDSAREIASSMSHPDFVYAGIAVNRAAAGSDIEADATLGEIEFPAARVTALLQIAAKRIVDNKTENAVATLEKADDACEEIEHAEEKIRLLTEVGNAFIAAGRKDKAIEMFDAARSHAEALDNVHRDSLLVGCAIGFLRAGSSELCDRTLDLVTDKTQMSSALLEIARDEWRCENRDDAIDTLDEAHQILKSQRDIETRDSRGRNALMTAIAVQFAGFSKPERGIEIAESNDDPDQRVSALSQIAQILTMQNAEDEARQTLNLIEDDANRAFCLIAMSDVVQKESVEAAASLLNEAAELAKTAPQLALGSNALTEIAARFAAIGQQESARAISLDNLAIISKIRDESSRAAALAALSEVCRDANLELGDGEKQNIAPILSKVEW